MAHERTLRRYLEEHLGIVAEDVVDSSVALLNIASQLRQRGNYASAKTFANLALDFGIRELGSDITEKFNIELDGVNKPDDAAILSTSKAFFEEADISYQGPNEEGHHVFLTRNKEEIYLCMRYSWNISEGSCVEVAWGKDLGKRINL